ncbi:MAG: AAA family ATPase [Acidobacteriota bacterium]|nr:AAA family ATPase [Acidobacteriota bacterium]
MTAQAPASRSSDSQSSDTPLTAASAEPRQLEDITPPKIFQELRRGVLGQDRALRFVSVAIYKHTTGKQPGNLLMIGNSGTGKTTIMNNIQRLYNEVPEYRPFRAVTVINANLLVDADRLEFRPNRLLAAVEQRARAIAGEKPSPEALQEAMERATVCIDEIDKMSTVLAGKPNALGVVLQQGLLTLMEGERVAYPIHAWVDGKEREIKVDIDTRHMMFVCGGAFESLYDQVYERVSKPGSGAKLRKRTVRTADGQARIETRFSLAELLKPMDLFDFGMVPQFMARFEKVVVLNDLSVSVLREILMESFDSPWVRARQFFRVMKIELDMEDLAAALIAEHAAKDTRTGARALRPVVSEILNPLEFNPWDHPSLEKTDDEHYHLTVSADMARKAIES